MGSDQDESPKPEATGRKIVTLNDIEARYAEKSYVAYYQWLRHVVTLSSGALTLLVGLQNSYIRPDAQDLGLLKLCWGSLGLSVLFGLLALFGEAQKPAEAGNNLRKLRQLVGDEEATEHVKYRKFSPALKRFWYYEEAMVLFFVLAVATGVVFAIWNLPAK